MGESTLKSNLGTIRKPRVVIAGGGGFLGRAVIRDLCKDYEVRVLTRFPESLAGDVRMMTADIRRCDLFSLLDAEQGIAGCDYAIFLVHSKLSAARLTQAEFQDLAFILTDNFAWACKKAGIRRISYLSDPIPDEAAVAFNNSDIMRRRRELEKILADYGTPLTTIRAGFLVGRGGDALRAFIQYVRRSPILFLPLWMNHRLRMTLLSDASRALREAIADDSREAKTLEIGLSRKFSYREIIDIISEELGVRKIRLKLPFYFMRLSRLALSGIADVSPTLIASIINRAEHDAASEGAYATGGEKALRAVISDALKVDFARRNARPRYTRDASVRGMCAARNVRSVQRLLLPQGRSAVWVSKRYALWLERMHSGIIRTRFERDSQKLIISFLKWPLLILRFSPRRSNPGRALYYITGGFLSSQQNICRGRQEFRLAADDSEVIAAIHDFNPRLPWHLYRYTQAYLHLWTMRLFNRYLTRYDGNKRKVPACKPGPSVSRSLGFFASPKKS